MDNKETPSLHSIKNILDRNFVLVFLAYFVFVAANQSLIATLPIFLSESGSNEREIGVLIGVFSISSLVSRLVVGGVLHRYSEKSLMMLGAMLSILAFLSLTILHPFWPIFIVRVFQGIAFASLHTAAFTYSISIIPLEYRGQGIAYFMVAPNLAITLAAPFGMFLINRYSFTVLFLFGACLSLCALFLPWKVKQRDQSIPHDRTPDWGNHFIEWKIVIPGLMNFLQVFIFGALAAFFPLYAIQCGVKNPGLFFSANALAIIVGRVFGGKILDTCNKEKVIPIFISLSIFAILILSFSKTLSLFLLAGVLLGIGVAFFTPAIMAYSLEYAGSLSGTAVGTYQALMDLGLAVGPLAMGVIIPLAGYRAMFLCLAFICLISLCYFQFYVTKRGHADTP